MQQTWKENYTLSDARMLDFYENKGDFTCSCGLEVQTSVDIPNNPRRENRVLSITTLLTADQS